MMMMTMIAVMMNMIGIVILVKVAIIIYDYDDENDIMMIHHQGNLIMLTNLSMVIGIIILMNMRMIKMIKMMVVMFLDAHPLLLLFVLIPSCSTDWRLPPQTAMEN